MTALSSLVRIPTIPRRRRATVTVALGLSAGAVGWSELASAEGQQLQTLILPDHYQRLSDGSLVVSSWTGEQLVLSRDQFLELEGGLMLVVDDLAVGAIRQLPLVGTLETHLISNAFPVRSSDGTIIGTQASSLLRSGEGTAPRLFEEVDIQRYELAQDLSDSSPAVVSAAAAAAGVGASGAGGGLLLGLALAGSDTSESETSETVAEPGTGSSTGSLHPYAGQTFLVDYLHPGADKNDGGYGTDPAYKHALDGKLYFNGYDGSEYELYVYDPDTGATTKVDDIHSGADLNSSGSSDPYYMHALDGKLYFRGDDGSEDELYVYDPNTGGTAKVDDIHSGADLTSSGSTSPSFLHALDGKLYFQGYDGSESELRVYDPEAGTTTKVASADIDMRDSTYPFDMHALNGQLYFTGTDIADERELYVYFPDDLTV